ncbi:MAG: pantoate--beta-alanine ligase [Actinobacteria bacterium HGW-Actinobacteria-5]|nr:MAG: pantoate--beta-alanine ligase [Actinobacteria bacterium HGW-Actinobacteria-5]
MRIVRDVAAVRAAVAGAGRVGLVPTMGAFHEGHLSLIRAARQACDLVVVWLFVNPTQFNEAADLAGYPRDEERDARLAAECGADILFAPPVEEVYPDGFATTVTVSGIADVLEGAHRPGHFDGVATVVAKMFAMVAPEVAYFGAKDAQQVAVVRRMETDLNLPVRIEVLPIVREPDGLAMSSRNVRLDPDQRRRATVLHRGLAAGRAAVAAGERDAGAAAAVVARELARASITAEYIAVVDPDTFAPLERIERPALIALAARVGPVRLIDNMEVAP